MTRGLNGRLERLERLINPGAVILVQFEDGTVTAGRRRFASMGEARAAFADGDRYRVVGVGPFDDSLKEV